MPDVFKLNDAICEAYDSFHTSIAVDAIHTTTFCNFAVDLVLARMGYEKMRNTDGSPMTADQMIDFMSRSDNFVAISMSEAQAMANKGHVIVAGMTSAQLVQEHGHVVVVRPGIEEYSGKYQKTCPKVSHVGANSHIGRGVSWAFGGNAIPKFWLLKDG